MLSLLLTVLDSTGKIPDGVFSGSMDFCEVLEVFAGLSCASQGAGALEGVITLPFGNTHAFGSFEGCLAAQSNINLTNPYLNPFSMKENFKGKWSLRRWGSYFNLTDGGRDSMARVLRNQGAAPRMGIGFGVASSVGETLKKILDLIINGETVSIPCGSDLGMRIRILLPCRPTMLSLELSCSTLLLWISTGQSVFQTLAQLMTFRITWMFCTIH